MDTDLSGDDIKVVSYSIVFAKPAAETTLQAEQTETVAYATNETSFSALKLGKFLNHLRRDGIPWPSAWTERPSDEYPEVGQPIKEIPQPDQKYIRFNYRVVLRQPKPDPRYDKNKTDALRQISDTLE